MEVFMKRIVLLLLPVLAAVLELLPSGAVLVFAVSPTERKIETCSYFSMLPFGYANFSPLITAALTCVVIVLAAVYAAKSGKKTGRATALFSLCAAVISVLPLLYGIEYMSLTGLAITLLLAAETGCAFLFSRGKE